MYGPGVIHYACCVFEQSIRSKSERLAFLKLAKSSPFKDEFYGQDNIRTSFRYPSYSYIITLEHPHIIILDCSKSTPSTFTGTLKYMIAFKILKPV